jgi:hypothetical protein
MADTLKRAFWVWMLYQLRAAVWAADEWIHAHELKLREPAAAPARVSDEFNVAKSAAREKAHKRAARAARPRLVYHGGQFVRQEGR